MRGALAEVEHRIVDPRPHVGEREELLRARECRRAAHRLAERLDVALLEVGHELRPRGEAGLAGEGELGVGERERSRRLAGVRAHRADARERGRVAVARGPKQILGELVLLFEIGGKTGDGFGVDTDDLLRSAPVSASWAEERSV